MFQIGSITSENNRRFPMVSSSESLFFSYAISYDASRSRDVSHQVRQEGRRLINETTNESWWNKHDKLLDREKNPTTRTSFPLSKFSVTFGSVIVSMKSINGEKIFNTPSEMSTEKFKLFNRPKNNVNDF